MQKLGSKRVLGLAAAVCLAAGCATTSEVGGDPTQGRGPDGAPRWVTRASGAYDGPHGKAFYGVGVVQGIESESLARQTAGNRARGEVAKIFDLYVAALMKDYQRSTNAGDPATSAEEQDVVSAQKTITETTLRGVEIREFWRQPGSEALYALAVLDLGNVAAALPNASNLPASVVQHVRDNARRAFDDLDRELGNRSASPLESGATPDAPVEAVEQPAPIVTPATKQPEPTAQPPSVAAPSGKKARVGLAVSGRDAKTIQTCFANRLIAAGYELFEGSSDVDVFVRGSLRYRRAGSVQGTVMVEAVVDVRVKRTTSRATLAALIEKVKVGRPTRQQALLTASTKLCDLVVPKMVTQIETALGR